MTPITATIMGILNVTPDSFSDTGKYLSPDAAIAWGRDLILKGAQIVDIGGEASGQGSTQCGVEEELSRVLPVVKALACETVVSVDTYKAAVARVCLESGARIINDISAARYDAEMYALVREFNAQIVLMYSKESAEHPLVTAKPDASGDIIDIIRAFLSKRVDAALAAGLTQAQIILDPGLGRFVSDNPARSWEIVDRYAELRESFSDFRFVIAASRKSFLGGSVGDRDASSQLVALCAIMRGADIVRTHNVAMASEFIATFNRALSRR